jgi:hypothetical protein
MKSVPCFEVNKKLEEAAREAEARKNRAIERLTERLGISTGDRFGRAVRDLINADKRALQEKGQ